MRVAYVEMIGGASGNMLLGALIDAGADADEIERALRTISVSGWTLHRERTVKCGIAAAYVDFAVPGEDHGPGKLVAHGHRLRDVLAIIQGSGLSARVRERAANIYRRLGEAEAIVHGTTVDAIHFHEVGQIDAILDVAGVCVALEMLDVQEVMCSAFPLGDGSISMHHGSSYPNPPPATAQLLRGAPTRPTDVTGELVTTTAAAILTTLVPAPGTRPAMTFERIGYGAGRSDFSVPNVTRVIIGEVTTVAPSSAPQWRPELVSDDVVVLETNIDDMSPQGYELALERIFAAGALDVWMTPIGMKKGRPAILLSALAAPSVADSCAQAMLTHTTSIGIRTRSETRVVLPREIVHQQTPFGEIRTKRVRVGNVIRTTLEYDDVAQIARAHDLPFTIVSDHLTGWLESKQCHEPTLV